MSTVDDLPSIVGKNGKNKKEDTLKKENEFVEAQATLMDIPTNVAVEYPDEPELTQPDDVILNSDQEKLDDIANRRRAKLKKAREALLEKKRMQKLIPPPDLITEISKVLDNRFEEINKRFDALTKIRAAEVNFSTADISVREPTVTQSRNPFDSTEVIQNEKQNFLPIQSSRNYNGLNSLKRKVSSFEFVNPEMQERLLKDAASGAKRTKSSFVLF